MARFGRFRAVNPAKRMGTGRLRETSEHGHRCRDGDLLSDDVKHESGEQIWCDVATWPVERIGSTDTSDQLRQRRIR